MPERLTDARIDELLALEEKATPGEWSVSESRGRDTRWLDIVAGEEEDEVMSGEPQMLEHIIHPSALQSVRASIDQIRNDLQLTAASRNSIRSLLEEVRERRAADGELLNVLRDCRERILSARISECARWGVEYHRWVAKEFTNGDPWLIPIDSAIERAEKEGKNR